MFEWFFDCIKKTTQPFENLPKAIIIVTSMLKTGDFAITGPTKRDGDKYLRKLSQEMGTKCKSRWKIKFFIKQVALKTKSFSWKTILLKI